MAAKRQNIDLTYTLYMMGGGEPHTHQCQYATKKAAAKAISVLKQSRLCQSIYVSYPRYPTVEGTPFDDVSYTRDIAAWSSAPEGTPFPRWNKTEL